MAGVLSVVLLVAGVVLMLAIHILVVYWALRRGVDVRSRGAGERVEEGGTGLSPDELEKLPCYDFKGGDETAGCAVCLEGFQVGERCRLLPRCEHSFHAQCVDYWLHKSQICPICRTEVVGHRKAGDTVAEVSRQEVAVGTMSERTRNLSPLQIISER